MTICMFNFYNYANNPIVKYCINKYKQMNIALDIRTLEDCMQDILKLKHAKNCLSAGLNSQIGDELRLYYASLSDDFIYVDSDSIVYNLDALKMNHACPHGKTVNEGSYFRANKNTDWIKYYLDKYEADSEHTLRNTRLFEKYPYDIPKQTLRHNHFYVSHFYRLPKLDKLYYTTDLNKAKQLKQPVLYINGISDIIRGNIIYVSNKLPLDLIKEQCSYSQGRELVLSEV